MAIPKELADRMMVECGRRCCLCRRFRPIHLQVHHIEERASGGSDDWDNLIALCLSCHTDVHSNVPFTRRFSADELKGHRAALFAMVLKGIFDPNEPDAYKPALPSEHTAAASGFSKEEILLLVNAANGKEQRKGLIIVSRVMSGTRYSAGNSSTLNANNDNRETVRFKEALDKLIERNLASPENETLTWLTTAGFLHADELIAQGASGDE